MLGALNFVRMVVEMFKGRTWKPVLAVGTRMIALTLISTWAPFKFAMMMNKTKQNKTKQNQQVRIRYLTCRRVDMGVLVVKSTPNCGQTDQA